MRYFNQGGGYFRVSYNEKDVETFSRTWPCSTVSGYGWFEFDSNGDLVDRGADTKYHERKDGPDWAAFSRDCQAYGEARRKREGGTLKPDWWFKTTEEAKGIKGEPLKIEYLKIATGETFIHVFGTAFWRDNCMDIVGMHECGITHWRNMVEGEEDRQEPQLR